MHAIVILGAAALAAAAVPPSNVDPTERLAWSENAGWLNTAGAEGGVRALHVSTSTLAGWIWSENTGWISVGDGSPSSGTSYANYDGSDFGVNIDSSTGLLSGLAWSENIGWINFGLFPDLIASGQHARADFTERRLRGYAWSPNLGWLNFDNADFAVRFCLGDMNSDGQSDFTDFLQFFNWFDQDSPQVDLDHDGEVNFLDFLWFFNAFDAGCF